MNRMMPMMRVVSLCTGIGGFDLACEATGRMEIVGQVEIDPFCNRVLEKHWLQVKRRLIQLPHTASRLTTPNKTWEPFGLQGGLGAGITGLHRVD